MKNLLGFQMKIVPEMIELLDKRYQILKSIYYNQPVGRRALSQEVKLGERIVRTEVNFLKDQGLVDINSIGMMVTSEGEAVLNNLEEMIHEINGLNKLEESLKEYLNISRVVIVPGEVDKDKAVLREMGRVGAGIIKNLIGENCIISLTGGSSVAQIVENFPKVNKSDALIVPARGGIGREVETQASTLASKLASKLGANYKLLHVPDNLSHDAIETMMNEPDIKDTIEILSKSDISIFGIGRADEMAKRRGFSSEEIESLTSKGAVSEAFGFYFNKAGEIVYKTPTIGLSFNDIKIIKNIISIAGGRSKAEAIIATKTFNSSQILITDEGAAREILRLKDLK